MKKPSPHRYLLGNSLVCLVVTSLASFVAYFWYDGELQVSALIPFFCVFFTLGCFKSRSEVRAYRAWAREWNAVAGSPAQTPKRSFRSYFKSLPLEWNVWLFLVLFGIGQPFDSAWAKQAYALAFIAATVWAVMRSIKRMRQRGHSQSEAERSAHIVQQCLPVPKRSPGIAEIQAALPDYCKRLLSTSDKGQSHDR